MDGLPQVGSRDSGSTSASCTRTAQDDYLLGVECDGATYHSAATARDRDKIRAAILESLGWRLLRVWSTDWWIDKQGSAGRLHALIGDQLADSRRAAEERAAAAAESALIVDSVATPIDPDRPEVPPAPVIPVPVETSNADLPEPVYARAAEPVVELPAEPAGEDLYQVTDFAPLASEIDPKRFHDTDYDTILSTLMTHVLTAEAPIAEALLVQRIARAHGFQRAGRVIRDRIMTLAERQHHVEEEVGGGRFVWTDSVAPSTWRWARRPASENDIRQIEEIALAELRIAARSGDPVEVARRFGIRRLSASARARIEMA